MSENKRVDPKKKKCCNSKERDILNPSIFKHFRGGRRVSDKQK